MNTFNKNRFKSSDKISTIETTTLSKLISPRQEKREYTYKKDPLLSSYILPNRQLLQADKIRSFIDKSALNYNDDYDFCINKQTKVNSVGKYLFFNDSNIHSIFNTNEENGKTDKKYEEKLINTESLNSRFQPTIKPKNSSFYDRPLTTREPAPQNFYATLSSFKATNQEKSKSISDTNELKKVVWSELATKKNSNPISLNNHNKSFKAIACIEEVIF